jgi:hypothetical protein
MRLLLICCLAVVSLTAVIAEAEAPTVAVQCKPDGNVWARGDCALGRGRHGQWARGSVRLLSNGQIQAKIGLETDSTFFGISGKLTFDFLDANGKVLVSGSTSVVHIPGKKPGKARRWETPWAGSATPQSISTDKIALVKSIRVTAIPLDDNAPQPFGLDTWSISMSGTF